MSEADVGASFRKCINTDRKMNKQKGRKKTFDNVKLSSQLQTLMQEKVTLNAFERKLHVDDFNRVQTKIIALMKDECELFKLLFERQYPTGSYFDRLRVSEATEFDMDVVIKLPISSSEIEVITSVSDPAFVMLKTRSTFDRLKKHKNGNCYRQLLSWRNEEGYLLPNKIRQWMEGTIHRALSRLQELSGGHFMYSDFVISMIKSGPALTLHIENKKCGRVLDVDFVPVLEFKYPQWPSKPFGQFTEIGRFCSNKVYESWFVVPKPNIAREEQCSGDICWRVAFPEQEQSLMHHKQNLKPVVRLLKYLRDKQNWHGLCSYYIKTVALWAVVEEKSSFWKGQLSETFFALLRRMHNMVLDGRIPFFWDKRCNLLEKMSDGEMVSIAFRLQKIITDIQNGNDIFIYFKDEKQ